MALVTHNAPVRDAGTTVPDAVESCFDGAPREVDLFGDCDARLGGDQSAECEELTLEEQLALDGDMLF